MQTDLLRPHYGGCVAGQPLCAHTKGMVRQRESRKSLKAEGVVQPKVAEGAAHGPAVTIALAVNLSEMPALQTSANFLVAD